MNAYSKNDFWRRWIYSMMRSKKTREAPHLEMGRWGEDQAKRFLKKTGYKVLAQRIHVGRHDELDLIVRRDDTLVFVEVKTRRNENYGRPAAAVDRHKRLKLSRAAIRFLKGRKIHPPYLRFDIVEVIGTPGTLPSKINHIENAFQLEGGYRIWW